MKFKKIIILLSASFFLFSSNLSAETEKECFEKFSRGVFKFNKGFDLRNVPTRIQLYIRSKSKLNIGTHCGFLDCVSRYSNVFQIQRVFPLNQNLIEAEYYINNENYKEVLTNV